ncbi:potassium channel subfamily k member 13, partial [Biomphalaria glabrata]
LALDKKSVGSSVRPWRSSGDVVVCPAQFRPSDSPISLGSDHEGGGAGDACVGGDRRGSLTEGRFRNNKSCPEKRGSTPRSSQRPDEVDAGAAPPQHPEGVVRGQGFRRGGGKATGVRRISNSCAQLDTIYISEGSNYKPDQLEPTSSARLNESYSDTCVAHIQESVPGLKHISNLTSEQYLQPRIFLEEAPLEPHKAESSVSTNNHRPLSGPSSSKSQTAFYHPIQDLRRNTGKENHLLGPNVFTKSLENGFHGSPIDTVPEVNHETLSSSRTSKNLKIQHIVKNGREVYPSGSDPGNAAISSALREQSPIWVTSTSRPGAVAAPEEPQDDEWAERVSLSDASDYQHPEPGRHSPRAGANPARTGKRKQGSKNNANSRSRRLMSRPGRRGCCRIIHLKEDNARFILLAVVMVLYMLSGAAVFNALERENELLEQATYKKRIEDFKSKYSNVNETDLLTLLDIHSEAELAGFTGNKRPRWDFSGAFYFVGTVVSTI